MVQWSLITYYIISKRKKLYVEAPLASQVFTPGLELINIHKATGEAAEYSYWCQVIGQNVIKRDVL